MREDKGFLSRWSDRKLRSESDDTDAALPTSDEAKPVEDEFEGKSDEEILSILELPEPDTLKLGDTVEKFMDNRVPERIRARALRAFGKQILCWRISTVSMSTAMITRMRQWLWRICRRFMRSGKDMPHRRWMR